VVRALRQVWASRIASSPPKTIREGIQRTRSREAMALPMNQTNARAPWVKSKHLFVSAKRSRKISNEFNAVSSGMSLAARNLPDDFQTG
jgi:hypothetical protein